MRQTVILAGAAGDGINTVEMIIEKLIKKSGYAFYAYKNYMSRIRGGYNFTAMTISDEPVYSADEKADIFVALNQEALDHATFQVKPEGTIIALDTYRMETAFSNVVWVSQEALKAVSNAKTAYGVATAGIVVKWFGVDASLLTLIHNAKWQQHINDANEAALRFGFDLVQSHMSSEKTCDGRIVLNGNQAVALGALSAGLGFYCAYPMAPSTGIMNYISANEKKANVVVEQAEDEIAAIMAAIGASSNGVRSMTGTSGGGFALMVEALGFSAVSEVPLVVCNVQRPGPATGLPTRTEQADLAFITTASQGEFARIVLAPRSIEDAFYTTFRAFNLADKYQVPVLILTDQLLADSSQTLDRFKLDDLEIQRYLSEEPVADYKRYAFDNLYGNRKYPGIDGETLIMTDSHVHDPYGHITESEEMTILLKNKFLNRLEHIKSSLNAPELYGCDDYDTLFLCWGSTYGALKESVDALIASGEKVAMLSFTDVYPIASDCLDGYMKGNPRLINVEGNAMNQFGKLLAMETGKRFSHSINKYDGRPFTRQFIIEAYEVINHG